MKKQQRVCEKLGKYCSVAIENMNNNIFATGCFKFGLPRGVASEVFFVFHMFFNCFSYVFHGLHSFPCVFHCIFVCVVISCHCFPYVFSYVFLVFVIFVYGSPMWFSCFVVFFTWDIILLSCWVFMSFHVWTEPIIEFFVKLLLLFIILLFCCVCNSLFCFQWCALWLFLWCFIVVYFPSFSQWIGFVWWYYFLLFIRDLY